MSSQILTLRGDPTPIVAVVFDTDGTILDHCFTWEAGQNYALCQGLRVVAVADDGYMTVPEAQALYDTEAERWRDCFTTTEETP